MPNTVETLSFQLNLQQLLAVIGPPAKATKCLESSFATAADVFEFWLAVQAAFEELTVPSFLFMFWRGFDVSATTVSIR